MPIARRFNLPLFVLVALALAVGLGGLVGASGEQPGAHDARDDVAEHAALASSLAPAVPERCSSVPAPRTRARTGHCQPRPGDARHRSPLAR